MNLSRRNFLLGASTAAAAAVVKANVPHSLIEAGAYLDVQPAWVPKGWLLPRGQALLRADYPRLFAAIGTAYGSDGPTTFKLPDFATNAERLLASDLTPCGLLVPLIASDVAHPYVPGTVFQHFVRKDA